jgi:hypothetical protein
MWRDLPLLSHVSYGCTVQAPEAKKSTPRKSKLGSLLLCNVVTISLPNFTNAMDPGCKNSL